MSDEDGRLRKAMEKDSEAPGIRLTDFGSDRPSRIEEYADARSLAKDLPDCPITVQAGEVGGKAAERFYKPLGWGRMYSSGTPDPYPGEPWAFDNGAWSAWRQGADFPEDEFLRRVDQARDIANETGNPPYLAVVPDRVGGGMESLRFSSDWMDRIEDELGWNDWPWYLAVQGDVDPEVVAQILPRYDGLFLGGGNEPKYAARRWQNVADDVGVPFHYGQCGTRDKLAHAFELEVDSLDSAGPRQTRSQFRKFLTCYAQLVRTHYGAESGTSPER